jgi:y4mF family transcriptional regulator
MQIKDAASFGAAVRECRKRQNMTQTQLAAVANTSQRLISALENGKPAVQLDKALRVAWMLGLRFETPDIKKDST